MKKRSLLILTFALMATVSFAQNTSDPLEGKDFSSLTSKNHPRLFITDADLKGIKKAPSSSLTGLFHKNTMELADTKGLEEKALNFEKGKGKTFLGTARAFNIRIMYAAYGYRVTKDKAYLLHAEEDINRFCENFGEWNTGYFLENGESAAALGLAYDWLFKNLSKKTKDNIVEWLEKYCYDACLKDTKQVWWYKASNNWNHVCNAGIVISALATYERHPEIARQLISKSILSNPKGMEGVYAPDGAGYEGPGYWNFATAYEDMLLMVLSDAFGTDFGLGDLPGFNKAGLFKVFAISNCNKQFNFADCGEKGGASVPLWYLAYRFKQPGLLFREVEYLKGEKPYGDRGFFVALASAYRMGDVEITPCKDRLYCARGTAPLVIARSGWEKNDPYLGIKGGTPKSNHGHMDVGSFVYDSEGVRWAMDMGAGPGGYERYRNAIRKTSGAKGDLFNTGQNSPRWRFFHHNNRQHNTLTINDSDQQVSGISDFTETFDEPGRIGGSFDLTSIYSNEAASVIRTAVIRDDSYLEVTDAVSALDSKPAHVRWSLVTPAKVSVEPDGIVLTVKKKSVKLTASGAPVEYRMYNSNAQASGEKFASFEADQSSKMTVCGFEFDIPAGGHVDMVTTLKNYKK